MVYNHVLIMPSLNHTQIGQLVSNVARKLRLSRLISELGFAVAIIFFAFATLLVLSIRFEFVKSGWTVLGFGVFIVGLLAYVWVKAWTSIDAQDAARI